MDDPKATARFRDTWGVRCLICCAAWAPDRQGGSMTRVRCWRRLRRGDGGPSAPPLRLSVSKTSTAATVHQPPPDISDTRLTSRFFNSWQRGQPPPFPRQQTEPDSVRPTALLTYRARPSVNAPSRMFLSAKAKIADSAQAPGAVTPCPPQSVASACQ
jgi:hypothetical protein